MPTGDEPMLPQPSDDAANCSNAPMIGQRGAKIIVEARGAYYAGNLLGLCDLMDDAKQLRFRQVLARQAIRYARQHVTDTSSVDNQSLEALEAWIRNPSPETAAEPLRILNESGRSTLVEMYWFKGATEYDDMRAARCAFFAAHIPRNERMMQLIDIPLAILTPERTRLLREHRERYLPLRQWQLDAAWAIMQGEEPPPLPEMPS